MPLNIGAIPMWSRAKSLKFGDVAPPFSLQKLSGHGTVSLSEFKGKFILLDFWGVWCDWCRKATSQLRQLYNRFAKSGRLVIISITQADDLKMTRQYVSAEKIPWTELVSPATPNYRSVWNIYHGEWPLFVLIGPDGRIVKIVHGYIGNFPAVMTHALAKGQVALPHLRKVP